MLIIISIILLCVLFCGILFYRHQSLLCDRAHLMREAINNRDYSFSLPIRQGWGGSLGLLFFGERALQQTLNDLGQDISHLVMQNEVESWQRLTRVLTHEIMNATAPIQSISQAYLASPKIKGTPYEEGIRAIYETSTGLANFVDSYRKLTQLQKANVTNLPLLPFVETIKALYNDIEWKIDIPSSATINADENLMRQILINIIKNAIEAGAKTIGIKYQLSLPRSEVRGGSLTISNDGAPIPPDVRRDIFVPFFTTKSSGNGIGLSLSRQLLMLQNMTMTLADTPDYGFHVTYCIETPI
ncbi:MAG: HAMP domain-containing histidine kinase [Prevotella sp.]|nr:HAMP domain-containing histidine kinase [Candidatus Prevotella equi]